MNQNGKLESIVYKRRKVEKLPKVNDAESDADVEEDKENDEDNASEDDEEEEEDPYAEINLRGKFFLSFYIISIKALLTN